MAYIPAKTPSRGKVSVVTKKIRTVRGVDFTTQFCSDMRSPDMQGMYRDWHSNGDCLVMFPGFRIIGDFSDSGNTKILGVHIIKIKIFDDSEDGGKEKTEASLVKKVIVHCGYKLYDWTNFHECDSAENADNNLCTEKTILFDGMSVDNKSKSFIFDNKLYIIDGKNYLVYDGKKCCAVSESEDVFVPTTYIARAYAGGGTQYQQRNLLTPKFKNKAYGDGVNKIFVLSEKELDSVDEVKINDIVKTEGVDYSVNLQDGKVTFTYAPPSPVLSGTDNIEFSVSKLIEGGLDKVVRNTEAAVFDSRVFLAGNPDAHNDLRWSGLDAPDYFGELNYIADGKGSAPIVNLIRVGTDTLAAVKADTQTDGVVYYHSPQNMNDDFLSRTYPAKAGLAGDGAVSLSCADTLEDDPVFLSKNGLKAIGKLSYGLERSVEHRSSFADGRLCSEPDKHKAVCTVWRGYYCVLFPSGNMYLADSRMKTTVEDSQNVEYEWFFIADIGIYEGQSPVDVDAGTGVAMSELENNILRAKTEEERSAAQYAFDNAAAVSEMRGGNFSPPTILFEHDEQLYFATESGRIVKFNADIAKDSSGELKATAFNNNGRKIKAYYCTPFSDFGAFNMLKKFEKKGNVLHARSFRSSWIKPSVRTDKSFWNSYRIVNSGYFDYSDFDYSDFTYNSFDLFSFSLRKLKEKKWQTAQIKIENGKINSAFGIFELDIRARILNLVKK